MRSIIKKVKTISKVGLQPYEEGKHNFENPSIITEDLAKKRALICVNCSMSKDEPISFLKVIDKRIKELSGKYCKDCGCVLSYKLRQNIEKCIKWKEE